MCAVYKIREYTERQRESAVIRSFVGSGQRRESVELAGGPEQYTAYADAGISSSVTDITAAPEPSENAGTQKTDGHNGSSASGEKETPPAPEKKKDTPAPEKETPAPEKKDSSEQEPDTEGVGTVDGDILWLDGGFTVTYYCPCEKCCGKGGGKSTASGTVPTAGRTIAVDTDQIPLGTEVVIDGHVYTAEDTGGGIKWNHIDIFVNEHQEALNLGRRKGVRVGIRR